MKTMGKREKFLLSFFIAVVLLFILIYIPGIFEYNNLLNNPEKSLSIQRFDNGDGIEYIERYFTDVYGVDINYYPEYLMADSIVYGTGMVMDGVFTIFCSVITLTTVIYLIMIIKIKSFKEYWKDLFKAILIILAVFLFTEIFSIIHYNFLIETDGIEYTILGTLVDVLMAWGTMIIGNLIINCKKLKFNKNNKK